MTHIHFSSSTATPDDIVHDVQRHYEVCKNAEDGWRARALDDLRFFHGDVHNHWQWEENVWNARTGQYGGSPRPTITVNKVAQHVFQIENDARQNQMGIKVNATGFGASEKAADVLEGIIRHIEYQSNAQQNAYASAIASQVRQGMGWVHLRTDWVRGRDSFDQDFFIESVPDPLSVYSDPHCRAPDHSDMQWAMLVQDMAREEFVRLYPDHDDVQGDPLTVINRDWAQDWADKERVRIARYYRRSEKKDTLWETPDGPMRESNLPREAIALLKAQKMEHRPITRQYVEWFLIAGNTVIDHGETVFQHIPLVPFIGIESVIDGQLDRHGLVRSLIDPQRMFNYSASAFVEGLGLAVKPQWLADAKAIEGFEEQWAVSNVSSAPFLPYNSMGDSAEPLTPPQRLDPPTGSPGHLQAMQNADLQMQMVTGQYQSEMGAPGNERSGAAINERQRQSDTANYHYTDNQGMALRLIGRLLVEAIPHLYDTRRAVQVMGVDGTRIDAIIDPNARQAAAQIDPATGQPVSPPSQDEQNTVQGAVLAINPTIGRYDVEADVGPAFATRRQDTFNSLMQVLQANPAMMGQIGDLFFKAADFPLADEIADRLKPPGENPQLSAAQQQIQALQQQLAQAQQEGQLKQTELQLKEQQAQAKAQTDAYKSETDRMAAIGSIDPNAFRPLIAQLVSEALQQGAPSPSQQSTPNAVQSLLQPEQEDQNQGPSEPLHRLPSNNPPGGPIHDPNPITGALEP